MYLSYRDPQHAFSVDMDVNTDLIECVQNIYVPDYAYSINFSDTKIRAL